MFFYLPLVGGKIIGLDSLFDPLPTPPRMKIIIRVGSESMSLGDLQAV